MAQNNEKVPATKAPAELPAYLQTDDTGVETIEPSDIVIPRIKIAQSTSHNAKKIITELKDGDVYNSLSNESYGNKVNIFVLLYWKSRVWFTDDFKMRGTIYNDIVTREKVKFGSDTSYCEKHWDEGIDAYNYMVITEKELQQSIKTNQIPFPSIFSCMSAAISSARQLNGKLKTNSLKRIPIYGQLTTIETYEHKFKKGQAFMPRFKYGRYATEEEFKFLKDFHNKCKELQKRADVHVEETEEKQEPVNTSEGDKTPF